MKFPLKALALLSYLGSFRRQYNKNTEHRLSAGKLPQPGCPKAQLSLLKSLRKIHLKSLQTSEEEGN